MARHHALLNPIGDPEAPRSTCPYCSYPLICQIRSGTLEWYCQHCHQAVPYAIANLPDSTNRVRNSTPTPYWQPMWNIVNQILDNLNPDQVLEQIVRETAQFHPAVVTAGLILYNSELHQWVHQHTIVNPSYCDIQLDRPGNGTYKFSLADLPQNWQHIPDGKLLRFTLADLSLCPDLDGAEMLAYPIREADRDPAGQLQVQGLLWLTWRSSHGEQPAPGELQFVVQMATYCALALQQANLRNTAQSQAAERAKLDRLKEDFLSTISHELRTPLSNIQMGLQLLEHSLGLPQIDPKLLQLAQIVDHPGIQDLVRTQMRADPLPGAACDRRSAHFSTAQVAQRPSSATTRNPAPATLSGLSALQVPASEQKIQRCLEMLQLECQREVRLIDDLLMLQALEAGTHQPMPTSVPLRDWLLETVIPFRALAAAREQTLTVEMQINAVMAYYDLSMLYRLVSELLTNACKFSPTGTTIAFKVWTVPGHVQFQVENSGSNIPPEDLSHLNQKFNRAAQAAQWQHSGTGLGLALAHRLARAMDGQLHIMSQVDRICVRAELPNPTPQAPAEEDDVLMGYVAYYLSRGKLIINPHTGVVPFKGQVYAYWGYHRDFIQFWQQIQQQQDFPQLFIEGDIYAFQQISQTGTQVSRCDHCQLLVCSVIGTMNYPLCSGLCESWVKEDSPSEPNSDRMTIVLIGQPPVPLETIAEWSRIHAFHLTWVASPDELTAVKLPDAVDWVIITSVQTEVEGQLWARRARQCLELSNVPIVALSPYAGYPQSRSNHSTVSALEDYLIAPLSGHHLALHLQHLSLGQPLPDLFWFPAWT